MTLIKCILCAGSALAAAFGTVNAPSDEPPRPASAIADLVASQQPVFDMSHVERMFRH
ncbi:hypothetical protein GJV26_02885 [Massilia dura]|uniref:DUF4148 domain-containing protein n=1 Tax=Pseudoduganella dura TaxID=321982 RepID=A0A6I3XFE7_9BURK|nr:hypothetical protein [Pseudoduganella dura]MUI11438.1 hypothetical protein [Pseudoduganella dura]GGX97734.1 hypothetical protein GCM10007386_30920 [Pseudoduganella dura]